MRVGSTPATTPMWTSRAGWLEELEHWLNTEDGRAACARVHVRLSMVVRVSEAFAEHADHGTGRHCAVTNAVVAAAAGCSPRTVTTVRRLLRDDAKLAVEIHRGTGCAAAPRAARRPSVWHLVSRREPVDNRAVCDLPPSRRDRRLALVGKNSPSTRKRAPQSKSPSKQPPQRARRYAPRPLRVQQLADELVGNDYGRSGLCHGLRRGHLGHICDALIRSGLDLDAWTGRSITVALNADMSARGWSWPNRIERPGAFLAARLRRLPVRPGGPHRGGVTAAGPDSGAADNAGISAPPSPPQHTSPERVAVSIPASAGHRAAALAEIRAAIARPKVAHR